MKISVRQLRRIIREALEEHGWVPGRWYPSSGEPVDDEDLDRMGHGGFRSEDPLEEDDELAEV
jgi:hypothetical protein